MKNLTSLLGLSIFLLSACSKPAIVVYPDPIVIGNTENTYYDLDHTDVNAVVPKAPGQAIYLIDINHDGSNDFKLVYTDVRNGSDSTLTYTIETLNRQSFVSCNTVYEKEIFTQGPAGGTTERETLSQPAVSEFQSGYGIGLGGNWLRGSFLIAEYKGSRDASSTPVRTQSKNWWAQEARYIGIRHAQSLGWIKLQLPVNGGCMQVYDYACVKLSD